MSHLVATKSSSPRKIFGCTRDLVTGSEGSLPSEVPVSHQREGSKLHRSTHRCTRELIAGQHKGALRHNRELVAVPESSSPRQESSSRTRKFIAGADVALGSSLLVAAQEGSSPHKRLIAGQHKRARRSRHSLGLVAARRRTRGLVAAQEAHCWAAQEGSPEQT